MELPAAWGAVRDRRHGDPRPGHYCTGSRLSSPADPLGRSSIDTPNGGRRPIVFVQSFQYSAPPTDRADLHRARNGTSVR